MNFTPSKTIIMVSFTSFICGRINSLQSFSTLLSITKVNLSDYLDLCVSKTMMIFSSSYDVLPHRQYTKCLDKISSFIKTPGCI